MSTCFKTIIAVAALFVAGLTSGDVRAEVPTLVLLIDNSGRQDAGAYQRGRDQIAEVLPRQAGLLEVEAVHVCAVNNDLSIAPPDVRKFELASFDRKAAWTLACQRYGVVGQGAKQAKDSLDRVEKAWAERTWMEAADHVRSIELVMSDMTDVLGVLRMIAEGSPEKLYVWFSDLNDEHENSDSLFAAEAAKGGLRGRSLAFYVPSIEDRSAPGGIDAVFERRKAKIERVAPGCRVLRAWRIDDSWRMLFEGRGEERSSQIAPMTTSGRGY